MLAGKSVIQGTRIPVELILMRRVGNPDLAGLFAEFPRLTVAHARATLAYAGVVVEGQEAVTVRLEGWCVEKRTTVKRFQPVYAPPASCGSILVSQDISSKSVSQE